MTFVPSWSGFSLPRRGRVCDLELDIADVLATEYQMARRAHNVAGIALWDTDSDGGGSDDSADDDDDGSSHSSGFSSCSLPTSFSDTDSEDTDSADTDYLPDYLPAEPDSADSEMPAASEISTAPPMELNQPILRPRLTRPPTVEMDLTPFPDSFSRGHLRALDFDFIKWHE
jgi:hypothetical protein